MISSMISSFFSISSLSSTLASLCSTCYLSFSPNLFVGFTKKWSSLAAIAHLLARYLEIFPLFFPMARPIKEVLKRSPYFGVLLFYFKALNKAFSAPKIWIVEAGYLAKVLKDPEWAISLAAIFSPISSVRLGETIYILFFRYPWIYFLNSNIFKVFSQSSFKHWMSNSLISCPIEFLQFSITFSAISASPQSSSNSARVTSVVSRLPIRWAAFTKVLLSVTILASYGKCHEYHYLTLIEKVLISLSRSSIKLMDWMIGLSFLLTSKEILFLENKWARPSLLWSKSTFSIS